MATEVSVHGVTKTNNLSCGETGPEVYNTGNKFQPWHMRGHLAEEGNIAEFVPPDSAKHPILHPA